MDATAAEAEELEKRQTALIDLGHSRAHAACLAADERGLLDGDVVTVTQLGGGCAKCGL